MSISPLPTRNPFYVAAPPAGGGYKKSSDPWGGSGDWATQPVAGTGYDSGTGYAEPTKPMQPQWGYDNGPNSQPYNPYNPYGWASDTKNGVFSGPNYDERWWQEHAGQYEQPSAAENYWNSVSGQFGAGPERSTGAQQGYDTWFQNLSQPGYTAAGAGQNHGSNYGETAANQRKGGETLSEMWANGPGASFAQYGDAAYRQGANKTTFDSGDVFDRYFDPLSQESNSEKLYGTDPGLGNYYSRAFETGKERLDNAAAAKGLFQSGYAGDQERELVKDLGAEQANREADYMLRAAGQSDSERRARMGLAGQLGSAADAASLGRSANERSWAGMLDDTQMNIAREHRAEREGADTNRLARDTNDRNWADMLDRNTLARSAEDRLWGTAADADRVSRSGAARDWADLLNKETNDNNKTALDYIKAGSDIATRSDEGLYGRLADSRTGSVTAANSLTKRYEDKFNQLLELAKAQSNIVSGAVDSSTKEKADAAMARIQATLAKAKAGQQLTQQEQADLEADLALAYRIYSGGGAGGGGDLTTPEGVSYGSAITDI